MRKALQVGVAILFPSALLPAPNVMDEIRRGSFARPSAAPQQLNILDWNIDRGTRLDRIGRGMEAQQPDLAILQEVDFNARRSNRVDVAQELAKRLNMNFVFATEFQELGQGSSDEPAYHGQAILTSLPILSTHMLRFQNQSGFWKPHAYLPAWGLFQRRLGGRIALVAEIEFNGRPLVIYNLHLESRSAGSIQLAQLNEVLADTARYPKDTPTMIAGDLNTKYRHSMKEVGQVLSDAGYENAFGGRHERTHMIVGLVDYIFVRGSIRVENAKVHREMHGSDHFAISGRLMAR
jgi:endonuclease/exonuclease/phosphatase family metal-dependent hydrolase